MNEYKDNLHNIKSELRTERNEWVFFLYKSYDWKYIKWFVKKQREIVEKIRKLSFSLSEAKVIINSFVIQFASLKPTICASFVFFNCVEHVFNEIKSLICV